VAPQYTPITFITLMCAGIAIAGIRPSRILQQDGILRQRLFGAVDVLDRLADSRMTAFYSFARCSSHFFGEYRGQKHPHESPYVMTVPLAVLACFSRWRIHQCPESGPIFPQK